MVETLIPQRNEQSTPSANEPSANEPFPTRRSLRAAAQTAPKAPRTPAASVAPAPPVYTNGTPQKPKGKSLQHRIVGIATVLLVPGIFAGTSIPAFALAGSSDATTASADIAGQSLVVDTALDGTDFSRDTFKATTSEQLAAKKQAQLYGTSGSSARASGGDYSKVTPRVAGDDYPYRNGGGLSPMGYVIRQCTDFVAWRLNRDAGYTHDYKYVWAMMTPNGGSASQWASAWRNNGWKTSHTPVKGSVAWFAGNHVAYVKSVSGGQVNLEEYNWGGDGAYHTRTIDASEVALFLYPPP